MSVRKDVTYSYNKLCHFTTSNTPFFNIGFKYKGVDGYNQINSILLKINDSNKYLKSNV